MPLRGSPLPCAFGLEGGAPVGLAEPVPGVPWRGLLRGHSIFDAVPVFRRDRLPGAGLGADNAAYVLSLIIGRPSRDASQAPGLLFF